ncbi:MAG TPA: FMN-binding negative transcriptional regulator [Streptosporangiaceae bacterium]|nr:FMN-binding negative transcriptional regulator [Streptosporangiaceae bacterium]
MYVPQLYEAGSPEWLRMIVSDYPLAILTTNGETVPYATHLPIICPSADTGTLVGSTLLGHLNKANPHWRSLVLGTRGVLIFTGPNGYVSPEIYQSTPAAPTWDYVSVHLTGRIHALTGREDALEVVKRTVRDYEPRFGTGWDMDGSLGYFQQLSPAVGAFRFEVESAEGMFKLSQEKESPVRQRIVDSFLNSESGIARDLGKIMDRLVILEEQNAG